jgi:hypothetical protein
MAIYELGAIIRDTMEYLLPPQDPTKGYSVEIYNQRKEMINHLVAENSPFALFCLNNKGLVKVPGPDGKLVDGDETIGGRISGQVNDFIKDVYGNDNPRIVHLENQVIEGKPTQVVKVDTSYVIQLMDYIVGLHETISDICLGFRDTFQKENTLEADFGQLLDVDDPFYRAVAFRSVSAIFVAKFVEFNNAVRSYIASEREKNGVDPSTQPGFDPKVDPSCAFIANEMNRVMGFFNFLRAHNKSKDIIFTSSIEKTADQFHYFDGSKKLAEGQKMEDAINGFQLIFAPLIPGYRDAWATVFNKVFGELVTYERQMLDKQQQSAKATATTATEKPAEEKKAAEPKPAEKK